MSAILPKQSAPLPTTVPILGETFQPPRSRPKEFRVGDIVETFYRMNSSRAGIVVGVDYTIQFPNKKIIPLPPENIKKITSETAFSEGRRLKSLRLPPEDELRWRQIFSKADRRPTKSSPSG